MILNISEPYVPDFIVAIAWKKKRQLNIRNGIRVHSRKSPPERAFFLRLLGYLRSILTNVAPVSANPS